MKKEWVHSNVPGFGNHSIKLEIEPVPPLLLLEEDEKFKDEKGNVVEIEVRGRLGKNLVQSKRCRKNVGIQRG